MDYVQNIVCYADFNILILMSCANNLLASISVGRSFRRFKLIRLIIDCNDFETRDAKLTANTINKVLCIDILLYNLCSFFFSIVYFCESVNHSRNDIHDFYLKNRISLSRILHGIFYVRYSHGRGKTSPTV